MPRKIPRSSSRSLVKSGSKLPSLRSGSGLAAGAYVLGETARATATAFTAAASMVASTTNSLSRCVEAYFGYLVECQRTRQVQIWSDTVIAEARERTAQVEAMAAALIADAQAFRRSVEANADVAMAQIQETRAARDSRMEIVRSFLSEHHRLHEIFTQQVQVAADNLSVQQRLRLTEYRAELMQRLRELELALSNVAHLI
jgi:hypothetical protein